MTVEPNWRKTVPEVVEPYVHSDTSLIQRLVDSGSLTPDTRLQAIADAWNDHGGYPDLHADNMDELRMMWPKLTALLDAYGDKPSAAIQKMMIDRELMTEAEWRDSLESGHVISVAGHRKVKGPHGSQWELTGHSDMKWPLEYGKRFALVELPAALGEQP